MKKLQNLGMLACVLAFTLVLPGCVSSLKDTYTGTAWNIGVPAAKDVKILGIVRYETIVDRGNGEKITYDALLREAEKLGGDGIVNIMIDVKRESSKLFTFIFSSKDTWYGSALAIKYSDENLTETTVSKENGTTTSTPKSSNQSGMNPDEGGEAGDQGKKFLGIF
ncbi:hypothetical protein TREPR_1318 [Treponema primitia ZAS-2]|uniref:Lipoprotein n=1 Tax=Treponema primitia (strain ATCC BAA-887 / DSM 12427 / ZAS-2) TaxID=545694 RepID=F5YQW6_TREPZ|nr:hypothetical protein [Treponema primitia]AEF86488.1 hypothetical protein TREPR_1318 [Treponema primitia ZAS-2]